MSEAEPRRGRAHNAKETREVILNAAEKVFAEHGFDGARIDAIAKVSGYNSSLIFQYFDDKLGLYAQVVRRADREMTEWQSQLLAPFLEDETIASNARRFREFFETTIQALFDYLVAHPRFVRIILWEQAEGWQTYAKIISQFDTEDLPQFERLFHKAYNAGLLRSDFVPMVQLTMALQICQSYLAFFPLYQMILPGEDFSSVTALARAREYIVEFIVHGLMVEPPETNPKIDSSHS
jgi:TetR/AcrR family transcriptional regulator